MPRRVKQVVYGIFYLAILGIIVAGIYFLFFKQAPSCFDGVQNEGEQGVDCGGPCAKVCIPSSIASIAPIGPVYVFSPVAGHVTVLTELENANSDFAAAAFDYVITLYGADGSSTVASIPGSSFAYAAETKYIVLPNEDVPANVSHADIAISSVQWVPASQMGAVPQFSFTNVSSSLAAENGYISVSGNITDRDVSSFNNIVVVAIFKDATGAPVGTSQTELDSLAPGATQDFSIIYPASSSTADVSAAELYAYADRN